jgi:hypothetical protein
MKYEVEWQDLRRRIRLFWIVWLGYLPGVLLIAFVLHKMSPGLSDRAVPWIAGAWMIAFVSGSFYRTAFRCPRCREWYFWGWIQNPFRRKCGHCGLRRWRDDEEISN